MKLYHEMTREELLQELLNKDAQTADTLKKVEEHYRALFTSMTIDFAQCDVIWDDSGYPCDYRIVEANDFLEEETGFRAVDLIGKTLHELFGDTVTSYVKSFEKVALTGELSRFDNYHPRTDRYFEVLAFSPAHGKIAFLFTNVTERNRSEQALRNSEERFRTLFMSLKDAFYLSEIIYDIAGNPCDYRFLEVNPAFEQIIGLNRDEVLGKRYKEVVVGGFSPEWLEVFFRVAQHGTPINFCFFLEHLDRHFEIFAFRPAQGQFAVLLSDVSQRRQADSVMARYQLINQYAHDPVLLMALNGRLIEVNHAAVELHGYSSEELLSLNIRDLLPPSGRADVSRRIERARTQGVVFESTHLCKKGTAIPVEVSVRGVVIHGEEMILSVVRNITERKQMQDALLKNQEDLKLANELLEQRVSERTADLEAAIREQESFSYSVSHDLRAPLRHINCFSTILLEEHSEDLPVQARSYLDRICIASSRMGSLIDHLLELSRVTRMPLQVGTVDLSELAATTLRMFEETDPGRSAEQVIEQGITVLGDSALLRQLLENLLGNSWKYTSKKPSARIEFGRCLLCGQEAYFVKDNGAGFDMTYRQKLFDTFGRLHGAEYEGVGIGLATAQRIVERHGGRIWAEGEVDLGATFYFTLPVYF